MAIVFRILGLGSLLLVVLSARAFAATAEDTKMFHQAITMEATRTSDPAVVSAVKVLIEKKFMSGPVLENAWELRAVNHPCFTSKVRVALVQEYLHEKSLPRAGAIVRQILHKGIYYLSFMNSSDSYLWVKMGYDGDILETKNAKSYDEAKSFEPAGTHIVPDFMLNH